MKAIASNGEEIKTGDEVLVRNNKNSAWLYCLFSHTNDNNVERKYVTSNISCKYCIPFKGNENLVGSTKDLTKPFKYRFGAKVKAFGGFSHRRTKLGILIGYDPNNYCEYKVAFQNGDGGDYDWFDKIEYLE